MPKRGRPSKGRMEALFTVAVSNAEYEELKVRAKNAGLPAAEWARRILLAEVPPVVPAPREHQGNTDPENGPERA